MYEDRIRRFKTEKGTRTEMRPEIVSGIVTGDAPVSYWPFFSFPWQNIQSLCKSLFGPISPSFLKYNLRSKLQTCSHEHATHKTQNCNEEGWGRSWSQLLLCLISPSSSLDADGSHVRRNARSTRPVRTLGPEKTSPKCKETTTTKKAHLSFA